MQRKGYHLRLFFHLFFFLLLLCSCIKKKSEGIGVFDTGQSNNQTENIPDLPEIEMGGELIVLTLYGPSSYFEFHGSDFGNQFLLVEQYARTIGVRVRVSLSRSQDELVEKLLKGEGDIIAYNLNTERYSSNTHIALCGIDVISHFMDTLSVVSTDESLRKFGKTAWAVRSDCPLLARSVDDWLTSNEDKLLSLSMPVLKDGGGRRTIPRRKVSSPMLDSSRGVISVYDGLFRRYANLCDWDWRLLAAQAYQESAFDPDAVSWMGAQGLMQLMPSTAKMMGVNQSEVFNPESNIRGATKLIKQLNTHYSSISRSEERINFILAAYNAGSGHVDDARRLAEKNGKNPNIWSGNVDEYVLKMRFPEYYNDPLVRHGYFNGNETYNYVVNIRNRWNEYKQKVR